MDNQTLNDLLRQRLAGVQPKPVEIKEEAKPKKPKKHIGDSTRKYKTTIKHRIYDKDVLAMFHKTNDRALKFVIAVLYRCGARPAELEELTRDKLSYTDLNLSITLKTLKLGRSKKTMQDERKLEFERGKGIDTDLLLEYIIRYRDGLPEGRLLTYCTRWIELKISAISQEVLGYPITPYHLRHSCFNNLVDKGYNENEIMFFKGAADIRSVRDYMHAKPFKVRSLVEHQTS